MNPVSSNTFKPFDPKNFAYNGFSGVDMIWDDIRIRALSVDDYKITLYICPEENIRDVTHLIDSTGFIHIRASEPNREARMTIQIAGLEKHLTREDFWVGDVVEVIPWEITNR